MIESNNNSDLYNKISLIVILLIALLLRLHGLESKSIWLDEGYSVWAITKPDLPKLFSSFIFFGQQPVYYLLLKQWFIFFGKSELILRLPNVFIGIFSIYILYKFCLLYLDKNTAIIASILAGFSITHINYSQEIRPYNLMILLTITSFYFFILLIQSGGIKNSILYSFISTALIYTHTFGPSALLIENIYFFTGIFLFKKVYKLSLKLWLKIQIFIFMFSLPYLYIVLTRIQNYKILFADWAPKPSPILIYHTLEETFSGSLPLFIIFMLLTIKVIVFSKDRPQIYLLILWWWFPIILLFTVSVLFYSIYIDRYLLPATLPFYCLVSKSLQETNKYLKPIILVIIIIFSISNIKDFYSESVNFKHRNVQYKEASKFIDNNAIQSDNILFIPSYIYDTIFTYYSRRNDLTIINIDINRAKDQAIKKTLSAKKRIWVFNNQYKHNHEKVYQLFSKNYELTIHKEFTGIDIKLFEKR